MAEEGLGRRPGAAEPHSSPGHERRELVVRQHDDGARARDRELLAGDRLAGLAEHLGVLEPDVRQQHDARVEDVRRVEPAAEPGFDDGDVDAALGEVGERRGGQHLELRRADRFGVGAHAGDRALEPVGVGLEPLAPAGDVR